MNSTILCQMINLLTLEKISDKLLSQILLSTKHNIQIFFKENYNNQNNLLEFYLTLAKSTILVVGSQNITRPIMENWRRYKPRENLLIISLGSSFSQIDLIAAKELGIDVHNTPGANSQAVSEYVIRQMMNLSVKKRDDMSAFDLKNGQIYPRQTYYSDGLWGKTLALIGTGNIGSKVARSALALGMKVKGYSPHFSIDKANSLGVEYCESIERVLAGSDYLSIQVPLKRQGEEHPTVNLLTYKRIEHLNRGAKIINCSYSEIINIDDLIKHLNSGHISGFALDAILRPCKEIVLKYPYLATHENTIITPSIATASDQTEKEMWKVAMDIIEKFIERNNLSESLLKDNIDPDRETRGDVVDSMYG
ncbi:MAG: NAD(P)-dependent oxidoreductase [Rickettsiaceae bacterium]|nr:NAD(P)-dependent oxidoreductase [Rickettsiaceae bacterium]